MINFVVNMLRPIVPHTHNQDPPKASIISIPIDVIRLIFDHLSNRDQCSLFKTCKSFRTLSPSNFFWRFANSRKCLNDEKVWANQEVFISYSPRNRTITHINSDIRVCGNGIEGEIINYFNNTIIVKRNLQVIRINTDNNSEVVQGLYNDTFKGEGLWHYKDPNGYHYFWKNEKFLALYQNESTSVDSVANELKDEIPNLKFNDFFQNPWTRMPRVSRELDDRVIRDIRNTITKKMYLDHSDKMRYFVSIDNVLLSLYYNFLSSNICVIHSLPSLPSKPLYLHETIEITKSLQLNKMVEQFEINKYFLAAILCNSNDIHVYNVKNGDFLCRIKPLKKPSSISLLDGKELSIICKYPDGQSEFFTSFKGKVL